MSNITIVLIVVGIIATIIGSLFVYYVLWPSILENRTIADIDFDDDDEIPDQDELEDDDDDDDDDDEEYDDDDDDDGYVENDPFEPDLILGQVVKEPSDFPDTITRLARMDWQSLREMRLELLRDERPEFFAPVAEYREFWRAEASAYKMAVDIDRARFRKEMKLAA